jgi:hypothetical protein
MDFCLCLSIRRRQTPASLILKAGRNGIHFPAVSVSAYNMNMGFAVRFRRCFVGLSAFLLVLSLHAQQDRRGRKYTPPPPTCKITVTVVKASTGKPIESAAVVFHPIKDNKDEGGLELKTNEEGKAVIDVIPVGDTLRLQIVKSGFQTFGNDYEIDKDSKEIVVKLLPPGHQYSIYEKHEEGKLQGGPAEEPKTDAAPPANAATPEQSGSTNNTSKNNKSGNAATPQTPPQQPQR